MKKQKYQKYFIATMAATVAASGVAAIAPNTTEASANFSDVSTTYNFYNEVMKLTERGIIKGFEDGTFRPGDNVTRGQAAKILVGAFKLHPFSEVTNPFTDIRSDYKNDVLALYENGVTTGKTATTFDGSSNVTRGQLAAFVIRVENVTPSKQQQLSLTIESVSTNSIQTSEGELKIASSLKSIFNSKNAAALAGANVTAVVTDSVITGISSLTFNTAGAEGKAVVFDGGSSTIQGTVVVNSDFIALKNVTVTGNVTLTAKVVNEFSTEGLVTNGELVIEEASNQVASINGFVADVSAKGPKIDLKKSNIKSVHAKRDNISLSSDTKLPEVKVSAI